MDRRDFLKKLGLATTTVAAFPAITKALPGKEEPKDQIPPTSDDEIKADYRVEANAVTLRGGLVDRTLLEEAIGESRARKVPLVVEFCTIQLPTGEEVDLATLPDWARFSRNKIEYV